MFFSEIHFPWFSDANLTKTQQNTYEEEMIP